MIFEQSVTSHRRSDALGDEFDVVSCAHGPRLIAVHDARMHSDMRHMIMHHHEFAFDRVFGEAASDACCCFFDMPVSWGVQPRHARM